MHSPATSNDITTFLLNLQILVNRHRGESVIRTEDLSLKPRSCGRASRQNREWAEGLNTMLRIIISRFKPTYLSTWVQ